MIRLRQNVFKNIRTLLQHEQEIKKKEIQSEDKGYLSVTMVRQNRRKKINYLLQFYSTLSENRFILKSKRKGATK
jgi:hypothetical protein